MIVMMKSGAWYPVDGDDEARVRAKYRMELKEIDLYNNKSVIVSRSGIDQLVSDEQFALLERRRQGDWRCRDGEWHTKADRYCGGHRPAEGPLNLSYLREGKEKAPLSDTGKRWLELMRLNNQHLRQHGKYGTLRTLEQLDEFEKTGEWPTEAPKRSSFGTRLVTRPKKRVVGAFPATKGEKVEYETVEVPL